LGPEPITKTESDEIEFLIVLSFFLDFFKNLLSSKFFDANFKEVREPVPSYLELILISFFNNCDTLSFAFQFKIT